MTDFKELFQTADFKSEKHVPVIECQESIKKGELVRITVTVGKEIAHPNKTEHHIRWIEVYFLADGEKFPCQLGRAEFLSHGESAKGPDTSGVYTHPQTVIGFKAETSGTIYAASFCNIHGLWKSSKAIEVK